MDLLNTLGAIHPQYIDCTFDMQTLTIHSIVIYQNHATDFWDDLHGMHLVNHQQCSLIE